jgi:hypothetical protein
MQSYRGEDFLKPADEALNIPRLEIAKIFYKLVDDFNLLQMGEFFAILAAEIKPQVSQRSVYHSENIVSSLTQDPVSHKFDSDILNIYFIALMRIFKKDEFKLDRSEQAEELGKIGELISQRQAAILNLGKEIQSIEEDFSEECSLTPDEEIDATEVSWLIQAKLDSIEKLKLSHNSLLAVKLDEIQSKDLEYSIKAMIFLLRDLCPEVDNENDYEFSQQRLDDFDEDTLLGLLPDSPCDQRAVLNTLMRLEGSDVASVSSPHESFFSLRTEMEEAAFVAKNTALSMKNKLIEFGMRYIDDVQHKELARKFIYAITEVDLDDDEHELFFKNTFIAFIRAYSSCSNDEAENMFYELISKPPAASPQPEKEAAPAAVSWVWAYVPFGLFGTSAEAMQQKLKEEQREILKKEFTLLKI